MRLSQRYQSYTVSKGTLEAEQLFANCLHFLQTSKMDRSLTEFIAHMEDRYREINSAGAPQNKERKAVKLLCGEILPLLETAAPEGHYFGFHPGDPGRLGFFRQDLLYSGTGSSASRSNGAGYSTER